MSDCQRVFFIEDLAIIINCFMRTKHTASSHLFNVVLGQSRRCDIHSILLHFLAHVSILDHCFSLLRHIVKVVVRLVQCIPFQCDKIIIFWFFSFENNATGTLWIFKFWNFGHLMSCGVAKLRYCQCLLEAASVLYCYCYCFALSIAIYWLLLASK